MAASEAHKVRTPELVRDDARPGDMVVLHGCSQVAIIPSTLSRVGTTYGPARALSSLCCGNG
jgi:hypothetical protein